MKIVIIDAGEVGYYLTKRPISKGNDVIIIEIYPENYRQVLESLDAIVIQCSGSSTKVLASANVLLAV